MLTHSVLTVCRQRHWERNVLELAVHSEMKHFTAHRHCQNLISACLHGDVDGDLIVAGSSTSVSHAMLPIRFARAPAQQDWLLILAHAACPCILKLRRAPRATREPTCTDFYRIPYVKTVLRMVLYQLYVALFSVRRIDTARSHKARSWGLLLRRHPSAIGNFHRLGADDLRCSSGTFAVCRHEPTPTNHQRLSGAILPSSGMDARTLDRLLNSG